MRVPAIEQLEDVARAAGGVEEKAAAALRLTAYPSSPVDGPLTRAMISEQFNALRRAGIIVTGDIKNMWGETSRGTTWFGNKGDLPFGIKYAGPETEYPSLKRLTSGGTITDLYVEHPDGMLQDVKFSNLTFPHGDGVFGSAAEGASMSVDISFKDGFSVSAIYGRGNGAVTSGLRLDNEEGVFGPAGQGASRRITMDLGQNVAVRPYEGTIVGEGHGGPELLQRTMPYRVTMEMPSRAYIEDAPRSRYGATYTYEKPSKVDLEDFGFGLSGTHENVSNVFVPLNPFQPIFLTGADETTSQIERSYRAVSEKDLSPLIRAKAAVDAGMSGDFHNQTVEGIRSELYAKRLADKFGLENYLIDRDELLRLVEDSLRT